MTIPAWFGEAVVTAIAAVLGFFGKGLVDYIRSRRARRRSELDELLRLQYVLEESDSVFRSQNYQARRLMTLLRERLGAQIPTGLGFDETFFRFFDAMVDEEKELHALIRATTMNSMKRLNDDLRSWLDQNTRFNEATGSPASARLADELDLLKLHLNQWHDKYAAIIPTDLRRSLVYLADEKKHGVGFPKSLSASVKEVIREIRE